MLGASTGGRKKKSGQSSRGAESWRWLSQAPEPGQPLCPRCAALVFFLSRSRECGSSTQHLLRFVLQFFVFTLRSRRRSDEVFSRRVAATFLLFYSAEEFGVFAKSKRWNSEREVELEGW